MIVLIVETGLIRFCASPKGKRVNMPNKVFVGNLPWDVDTEKLSTFLTEEGYTYRSVKVIEDQATKRSRGFAFVEFETPQAASEAIVSLTGTVCGGRALFANEAKDTKSGSGRANQKPRSNERAENRGGARGDSPRRDKSNKPRRGGGDDFGW